MMQAWKALERRVVRCERCPRLRNYCAEVARRKRRAFQDWEYWGRPVPNFGDPRAALLIVGLAPAAHGANRTGRMFTGDRSGDWLYGALHESGFSSRATSTHAGDDLQLRNCAITAVCHCAPPGNKPDRSDLQNCRDWLAETMRIVDPHVLLALGQIAWHGTLAELVALGWHTGRRPRFGHGARVPLSGGRWLLGSYHPSQQNTFTGRLTRAMFQGVFDAAREFVEGRGKPEGMRE
jgi:uracil-DNA glycosylase family 4